MILIKNETGHEKNIHHEPLSGLQDLVIKNLFSLHKCFNSPSNTGTLR